MRDVDKSPQGDRRESGSPRTGEERGDVVRKASIIVGTLLFVVGTASATPAASAKASVTIVHGLPGFTADIYLDGELLLDGFEPTSTAGPLRVAPRSYDVDIREVGAPADSPPALSGTLPVTAGSNISVVAHLSRAGDATLTVFENTFRRLPAGRSLLRVRYVAAGPPLSVRFDGRVVKEDLRIRREWGTTTAPGRHRIAFGSSSANDLLIPASDIRLEEGIAQIVYVVGSAGSDNLELMLQSVRGFRSAPSGVLTGDGGLGAEPMFPGWSLAVMVAAGVTLLVCTREFLMVRVRGR
jgi:hypothetical protein